MSPNGTAGWLQALDQQQQRQQRAVATAAAAAALAKQMFRLQASFTPGICASLFTLMCL